MRSLQSLALYLLMCSVSLAGDWSAANISNTTTETALAHGDDNPGIVAQDSTTDGSPAESLGDYNLVNDNHYALTSPDGSAFRSYVGSDYVVGATAASGLTTAGQGGSEGVSTYSYTVERVDQFLAGKSGSFNLNSRFEVDAGSNVDVTNGTTLYLRVRRWDLASASWDGVCIMLATYNATQEDWWLIYTDDYNGTLTGWAGGKSFTENIPLNNGGGGSINQWDILDVTVESDGTGGQRTDGTPVGSDFKAQATVTLDDSID